jgi:hypothetical protein
MLTEEQDQTVVKIARWIKAHHQKYVSITAVSKIPNYRKILRDLKK